MNDEVRQMEKGLPGDDFARSQPTPQVTQRDDSRHLPWQQVAHHLAPAALHCMDFRAVKDRSGDNVLKVNVKDQPWRQRPEGRCEGPALETTS